MKKILSLLLVGTFTLSLHAIDYTKYVNPFIGTQTDNSGALSGGTFPGATMPQGMVQLSPDTEPYVTWDPCSGYEYNRDSIFGFTHTHLSGTGCTDLIDISIMPTTKKVTPKMLSRGLFGLPFTHNKEQASPGYYMVELQGGENIKAEMTATTRTGIHRYTFPQGTQPTIILDLDRMTYRGDAYYTGRRDYDIIQAQLRVVSPQVVEGYRVLTGWAKLRKVYFRAEFSKPIVSRIIMNGNHNLGNADVINGRTLRTALQFENDGNPLIIKVAISPVDIKGARINMNVEAKQWNFDEYKHQAHDIWEKQLSLIDIEGTDAEKKTFYTGLYHVLMQPNTMSDVDGRYMDPNFQIKRMPKGESYHSTFSLWDTFRAAHPLYTLLYPKIASQFVRDMVRHHETYGYLPIWDLWGQDNYCMIGNHAIPVISDAILAELPGINYERAYKAMVESSTRNHPNSPFDIWEKYGYMPQNKQGTSVSITLEQAFDDWCVAAVANKLGHKEDYNRFIRRSEFYRNLWDSSICFFRAKDDKGQWIEPFDPLSYEEPCFIEGNAWQYMWFVPQNPQGLIDLFGSKTNFIKKLDENFTLTATSGKINGNASGFVGQYAHGNEPSHHTAYLYNFAGRPDKTQLMVDKIRSAFYNDTPCGYAGNDDCGQMSAWYIFSALGFYPFNAGSAEYVIGTPLFKKATLHLVEGKDFTIIASNKKEGKAIVKQTKLNGKKLNGFILKHSDIISGGTLEFIMK